MATAAKPEGLVPPPEGGLQYGTYHPELDERFLQLDDEETAFLSSQTGIQDPDALKQHVLQVQREVYAVSTLEPGL